MSGQRVFKIHYSCGAFEATKVISEDSTIADEVGRICRIDDRIRRTLPNFVEIANVNESLHFTAFTGSEIWTRIE